MKSQKTNQNKNKHKRILVIGQHFWPESFRINDICDFFIENGCTVDVLCGIPNYPQGKFFDGYSYFKNRNQIHNGVRIRRVFEIPRGNNSNIRIFLNYISFPLASILHIPRLLTRKYDQIFIFQTSPVMMGIAGIVVGKIKKIPITMQVLDLWPENLFSVIEVKNSLFRQLATSISHWHYRKADKLIPLSNKMCNRLTQVTGKVDADFLVIPQACEKVYETDIQDKELSKRFRSGFNILFTGSITPAQSFDTIIEAAALLKKQGITDINWIIVGDGMSKQSVEKAVEKAGLRQQFYFEGQKPITDIPKYTTVADVLLGCLVKSNLLEATIPAKVMSYFAAGRPIVLAMDGEVQDLVNNTIKCGYAGPTEDANVLAANIKKLYQMPAKQRNVVGKRGRDYHFEHFERNLILGKMYNFIFDETLVE